MAVSRLTGRRARQALSFDLPLSLGVVTLRRVDLMNQWLLGKCDQAMVASVAAAERTFAALDPATTTFEALDGLAPEERRTLIDGLRRFACLAIISPRVTFEDDGDPEAVPAELLTFPDLMAVWNAKPPDHVAADPDQPLAVPAEEGGATRFPDATADAAPAEPIRDHAAGTGGALEAVGVQAQPTPYRGLASFTTH